MLDQKALKKSFWGSLARLIGVGLGAGTGSLIHQLLGGGISGWSVAVVMAIVSFVLMWISEYEREKIE